MKTFICSIALSLFLLIGGTVKAQDIVLEFIPLAVSGPTTYTAAIPITSAQFSYTNPAGFVSPTGGKVGFLELSVTKPVDAASLSIARNMWAGAAYQYARLSFYKTGTSGRQLVYRAVFGTVYTTKIANAAEAGCTSGCPAVAETVTFAYGQVALYNPALSINVVGWDQVKNVAWSVPNTIITAN